MPDARRHIGLFYLKVYLIILVGLMRGIQDFPSDILLVFSGSLMFFQLFVVAQRNSRLFHSQLVQICLVFTKLATCVDSSDLFPGVPEPGDPQLAGH